MRLYRRRGTPHYWVRYRTPSGELRRESTKASEKRAAEQSARALIESATRDWSRQETLFGSRDRYTFETAIEDWQRERIHESIAPATLEVDGQNLRYLGAAADAAGVRFFGGRLLRDIDAATILDYVTQQKALGLLPETISKRLCTLRKILASAAARRGSDLRPLLAVVPIIPSLGLSREPDGWGRALTREEFAALCAALPTTGDIAGGATPGRGGARRPCRAVDQRGWVQVCVLTAEHPSDVNDFCGQHVNLSERTVQISFEGRPFTLPPWSYLWRNTKNTRRTRAKKIRAQVRAMSSGLVEVLAELAERRGVAVDVPLAGYWASGARSRALRLACLRAGLPPVTDDRGKIHYVSANDLRRTGATWIAEAALEMGSGPDRSAIELIADHLGHVGIEVARAIYDRGTNARLDRAALLLGHAWGRRGPRSAAAPLSMLDYLKRKTK